MCLTSPATAQQLRNSDSEFEIIVAESRTSDSKPYTNVTNRNAAKPELVTNLQALHAYDDGWMTSAYWTRICHRTDDPRLHAAVSKFGLFDSAGDAVALLTRLASRWHPK